MASFRLQLQVFPPNFAFVPQLQVTELLHFEVKFNMAAAAILDFVGTHFTV